MNACCRCPPPPPPRPLSQHTRQPMHALPSLAQAQMTISPEQCAVLTHTMSQYEARVAELRARTSEALSSLQSELVRLPLLLLLLLLRSGTRALTMTKPLCL
jgi:hypothetical protein